MCGCRFGVCIGKGEFRLFLYHHCGQVSVWMLLEGSELDTKSASLMVFFLLFRGHPCIPIAVNCQVKFP